MILMWCFTIDKRCPGGQGEQNHYGFMAGICLTTEISSDRMPGIYQVLSRW